MQSMLHLDLSCGHISTKISTYSDKPLECDCNLGSFLLLPSSTYFFILLKKTNSSAMEILFGFAVLLIVMVTCT